MTDIGPQKKSLVALLADLPRLLIALAKEELERLKLELLGKLKHAGIGIGLLIFAAVLAFFLLAVLLTAAVLGFATIVAPWLAALIVAGILLLIIAILVLVGVGQLKRGAPVPTETIDSVKKDVNAIKGIGKRETP
ncbi:MAG: phage holin family protein [Lacisediminihabitans sp.]